MPRLLAVLLVAAVLVRPAYSDPPVDTLFEQSVGPLIIRRCAGCHNPSELKGGLDLTSREKLIAGGDSGPALTPGNVEDSLLWHRVSSKEMPPKTPLSDADQALLKDWIGGGATWSGGALDPFQFTTSERAGYDWWSLQPIRGESSKVGKSSQDARNPIDQFVAEELQRGQLTPSPPADRRTLIRRLYFDLIGLPPDPEEVDAFASDSFPSAYERLVDRLLASPAYGERWARHWLDIIRFGESQGFERDKLRTNSWRYRDWVIQAWNKDLPYDEFARAQLAGDVLKPGDADSLIATGFLVAGPYDEVGQQQQSVAMRAVVREDELEDLVGAIGQTFLGLTVNCSRCHDHKFDPVRQTEYYQMTAVLSGVKHGEPELPAETNLADQARDASLGHRIRRLSERLAAIEAPYRERVTAEWQARRNSRQPPAPIASWDFQENARDSIGELHGELRDGAKIRDGMLVLDGKGYLRTPPISNPLLEKTLEAWVTLKDLSQQGGGVIGVQSLDGQTFDAIVFGEREPRRWLAGSNFYERSQSFSGPEEARSSQPVHVAIVYHKDGTVVGYRDGVRYGKEYKSNGPKPFDAGKSQVILGLRHSPPGDNKLLRGAIDRARLYDRALNDDEIANSAQAAGPTITDEQIAAGLSAELRAERSELQFELDQLKQHQTRLRDRKIYAVAPTTPAPSFVLIRGNPTQKGNPVSPGGIAALGNLDVTTDLPAECSDADRRRWLASWICNKQNPLFARVIVNRLWQYHFGTGIVETPNDFGFNGGRPSHPKLLDWLSAELIRGGWSLKHLQRLIVSSATYRQSSRIRPDAQKRDAANRLLWRKTPQRLEAESLRDVLLLLAGELDTSMGGPGFYDFSTFTSNSQFYEIRDPTGASFSRRSIYRTWVRSGRSPFLDVFDCPDPSTKTPQRAVTTTPLQALSLLNNGFVLRMADQFSGRVEREVGQDIEQQVRRAFKLALSRDVDPDELRLSSEFVREHGLSELCRVLYNSSELLYVD